MREEEVLNADCYSIGRVYNKLRGEFAKVLWSVEKNHMQQSRDPKMGIHTISSNLKKIIYQGQANKVGNSNQSNMSTV